MRPVGSSAEVSVDARVIASTNRDPEHALRDGQFRQDLYYRLTIYERTTNPNADFRRSLR